MSSFWGLPLPVPVPSPKFQSYWAAGGTCRWAIGAPLKLGGWGSRELSLGGALGDRSCGVRGCWARPREGAQPFVCALAPLRRALEGPQREPWTAPADGPPQPAAAATRARGFRACSPGGWGPERGARSRRWAFPVSGLVPGPPCPGRSGAHGGCEGRPSSWVGGDAPGRGVPRSCRPQPWTARACSLVLPFSPVKSACRFGGHRHKAGFPGEVRWEGSPRGPDGCVTNGISGEQ